MNGSLFHLAFPIHNIEMAKRFYVDGLGFKMTKAWRPEEAGGRIEWCWLELGGVALMLQEYRKAMVPEGPLGQGVSVCLMCADAIAIYHEITARGITAQRPFVGNGLWVTSMKDPDGYHLDFESPTDVPEDTVYEG